ncbi:MAG: DUF2254 domain-containing protein [Planctomycetaceae bacterium]|nr:DUF2254 domain-containing protein [Planctomycetaceae bacterium]
MRVWFYFIWDHLRSSFWFVPLSMMVLAALLALFMTWVDDQIPLANDGPFSWLRVNAATARGTLSLLAGAMITLSGVVFSMTMVTLSLTSSQFGSRLLRTAMTDLTTQVALGVFLAASLYCLVVLRFIPADADSPFVPHLAVFLGGGLTLASLVTMILFVHHIGVKVQAQNVVAEVATDLNAAIERLFPERLGESLSQDEKQHETSNRQVNYSDLGSQADESDPTLPATVEGYLQTVDEEALLELAQKNDLVMELLYRPGDFVIAGTPFVQLRAMAGRTPDEDEQKRLTKSLNAAILTGRRRTPRQDLCCAVSELVEIAVRALSPGINDPFTAITAIDHMTIAISRLLARSLPSPFRYDSDKNLRVIATPVTIPSVLETAFLQIAHYGAHDWMICFRMMQSFQQLMSAAQRDSDREAICHQAERLYHRAKQSDILPSDLERLESLRDEICGWDNKNTG